MLSAQSPKYPALYDEESRVRFILGHAKVTEEQAHKLAERPFVDGILIGEFDEDGRPINGQAAKKWAAVQSGNKVTEITIDGERQDVTEYVASEETGGSGTDEQDPPAEATTVARKTRSK